MGKKNFIPNVVFFIRLALLLCIVGSMIWLNNLVTGVLYLLSLSMLVVEILLGKEMKKNSLFETYAVPLTNRLLVLLPLVYIAFKSQINVWLVVIAIFFDAISALYVYVVGKREEMSNSKPKINYFKVVYNTYLLLMFAALFLYFFVPDYSVYFLYAAIIVCAVYIILQSVKIPEVKAEEVQSEQENKAGDVEALSTTKAETSEELTVELNNSESRQNEIVE